MSNVATATENKPAMPGSELFASLNAADFNAQIAKALPKHITADKLMRVALTAIRTNPDLLNCSPMSLKASIMGAAQLGLLPDPVLGQAYLVPYNVKKKFNGREVWVKECQLIPGYKGLITLARNSGEVQSITVQAVYKNDEFHLQFGLEERCDLIPAEGERGEFRGAFVLVRYKDGSHSFDYMSKSDIDRIRAKSKAKYGPWETDYDEMAKKTVIRRHFKVVPLSVDLARALGAEDRAIQGQSQIDFFVESGGDSAEMESTAIEAEVVKTIWEHLDENYAEPDRPLAIETAKKFVSFVSAQTGQTEESILADASKKPGEFFDGMDTWTAKQVEGGK